MSGPLIIELRANETADQGASPSLPLTPTEIIDDAVAAYHAGASILHWHARDPGSGMPSNDVELYLDVCRGVREATELLLHPTLGYLVDQDPLGRTRHIAAAATDPTMRVDLAPVDFGSINVDHWDPDQRRFVTEDLVYLNPRANLRRMLETLNDLEVSVVSVCWNPGQMRTARCYQEMGLLGSTLWEFVFTGPTVPDGMPPTRAGLEAMIEQVPDGQHWSVICWNGDATDLARWAVARGGHVSIGLGDWPYPQWDTPTNATIIARVVALAEAAGRPVATPTEARRLLGLPPRPQAAERSMSRQADGT